MKDDFLGDPRREEVVASVFATNRRTAPDPMIGQLETAAGDRGLESRDEGAGRGRGHTGSRLIGGAGAHGRDQRSGDGDRAEAREEGSSVHAGFRFGG